MTDGTHFSKDNFIDLANGRFSGTTRFDLDSAFAALDNDPNNATLVVYFHGGLVDQASGMSIARDLYPLFREAGAFPLFFVWQAGFVEIIRNNLDEIFDERIFQRLLEKVMRFALGKITQTDGDRATGTLSTPTRKEVLDELRQPKNRQEPFADVTASRIPADTQLSEDDIKRFEIELNADSALRTEAQAIANTIRSDAEMEAQRSTSRGLVAQKSTHTLMSPHIVEELKANVNNPGERGGLTPLGIIVGAVKILARVISRFVNRRDHGLYPTVVEEILREFYLDNVGQVFWSQTKKDTVDAFGPDPECGGTAFFAALKSRLEAGKRPRIVLIGHSTGAIYINNFLHHAAPLLDADPHMQDVKFDILFLAPACTFQAFHETLQNAGHRIGGIRVFAMRDSLESADQLVPLVYTRSLLYFVSGVTEDETDMPLVGMERYYSGKPPYDVPAPVMEEVRKFLLNTPGRMILSKAAGGNGFSSSSTSHGDFDNNPDTRESLKQILQKGL